MGWWNTHWDDLEPETQAHIKAQRSDMGINITGYSCGCESTKKDPGLWHLCDWHEGFDEGVVTAASRPKEGENDGN